MFRCLAVDADIFDMWSDIFLNSFGVVNKDDEDGDGNTTGEIILDLFYPDDSSVNSHTSIDNIPKASISTALVLRAELSAAGETRHRQKSS